MTARRAQADIDNPADVVVYSDEIFEFPREHPVMAARQTAHPKAVVLVTRSGPELLLEALPHLGELVAAGPLAGYRIRALTLVERATCPTDCPVMGFCCGNYLPQQRRLQIGDSAVFYARMEAEIEALLDAHPAGVLLKVHELGDFASVDYVYFWHDMLERFSKLALFGSTHHKPSRRGGGGVGDAIEILKGSYPSRFLIRWSLKEAGSDGMIVIVNHDGRKRRVLDGLVCPQHLGEKKDCASCGLCFSESMKNDCIAFPKQGHLTLTPKKSAVRGPDGVVPMLSRPAPAPAPRPRATPTFSGSIPNLSPRRAPESKPIKLAPVVREPSPAPRPAEAQPTAAAREPNRNRQVVAAAPKVDVRSVPIRPQVEPVSKIKEPPMMADQPMPPAAPTAAAILADVPSPGISGSVRRIEAVKLPGAEPVTKIGAPPEYRLVDPATLLVEESYQRNLSRKSLSLLRRIVEGWDWRKFKAPIVAETPEGLFVIDGQHTCIGAVTLHIAEIPVALHHIETLAERAESFAAHNRERVAMTEFQVFHAQAVAGDSFVNEILQIVTSAGAHLPRNSYIKNRAPMGTVTAVTELRSIYRTHGSQVLRRIIQTSVGAGLPIINKAILQGVRMVLVEPAFAGFRDEEVVAAIRSFENFDDEADEFSRVSGQKKARAIAVMIRDRARQSAAAAA